MKFLETLSLAYGRGRKFHDRSEAIRYYIERGMQFESLLEIYNDPEKKAQFAHKMEGIKKEQHMERLAETMTIDEIKSARFILTNIEEKKVNQLLLDVTRS